MADKYRLEYEYNLMKGTFIRESDNFHIIVNILAQKAFQNDLRHWRLVKVLPGMDQVLAVKDPEF